MEKNPFHNLTFEKFRERALDSRLSENEKVGFPDSYRKGKEKVIYRDIKTKLSNLSNKKKNILDIGPGCSPLTFEIIKNLKQEDKYLICDSKEMLNHIPSSNNILKFPGSFPNSFKDYQKWEKNIDVIIVYSVIQYIFVEGNIWDFIDKCLGLLSDNGQLLIGDIPNNTMRKRFFSSKTGIKFHQEFTQKNEVPEIVFNNIEPNNIDDSVIVSLILRSRAQGFNAWILPQDNNLPLANRREDVLIQKP